IAGHKDASLQIDDCKLVSGAGDALEHAETGGSGRIVGRTKHAVRNTIVIASGALKKIDDLFFVPNVVAGGKHLYAQSQKLLDKGRCDAEASGGVFAIGQHEIDLVPSDQGGKLLAHNRATRTSEDVANEKNTHSYDSSIRRKQSAPTASRGRFSRQRSAK